MKDFYTYLDIQLKLKDETAVVLTAAYFQGSLESSLINLFGEIGGQTDLELLEFNVKQKRAIIRIPRKFYRKTRAAISLIGQYQDIACHFKVLNESNRSLHL